MSGGEGDCPKREPGRELSLTLIHAGVGWPRQDLISVITPVPLQPRPPAAEDPDPLPACWPFYRVITTSLFPLVPLHSC